MTPDEFIRFIDAWKGRQQDIRWNNLTWDDLRHALYYPVMLTMGQVVAVRFPWASPSSHAQQPPKLPDGAAMAEELDTWLRQNLRPQKGQG